MDDNMHGLDVLEKSDPHQERTLNDLLSRIKDVFQKKDKDPDGQNDLLSRLTSVQAELDNRLRIINQFAIVTESDLKGNITYANDKFCEVSGWSREECMGKPHSIVRHPSVPPAVFKELWATIGRGEVWQGEVINLTKDGRDYWVIATIAPVMGANGKPVKYVSVRVDITQQKLIERALEETQNRLREELDENVAYASRIQQAVMPHPDVLKEGFEDHVLFFHPMRSVGGDFYWFTKKRGKTILAVGDCTGHGVSAAFMSLITMNLLERIVELQGTTEPASVLEDLDSELRRMLTTNKEHNLIDSVDLIYCVIDPQRMEMTYFNAGRPIYIVRGKDLLLLAKQNMTVGGKDLQRRHFENHTFKLEKDDLLYLFSDGLTDQFGGPDLRRYGSARLREVLIEHHDKPLRQQAAQLLQDWHHWRGQGQQTDDLIVLGAKV